MHPRVSEKFCIQRASSVFNAGKYSSTTLIKICQINGSIDVGVSDAWVPLSHGNWGHLIKKNSLKGITYL